MLEIEENFFSGGQEYSNIFLNEYIIVHSNQLSIYKKKKQNNNNNTKPFIDNNIINIAHISDKEQFCILDHSYLNDMLNLQDIIFKKLKKEGTEKFLYRKSKEEYENLLKDKDKKFYTLDLSLLLRKDRNNHLSIA